MDDTTVPLLARGGAKKARLWTYMRGGRPWNGGAPSAAVFRFSRDRAAINPISPSPDAAERALHGVGLGRNHGS